MPESLNLLQLLAPDFINIFVECQWVSFRRLSLPSEKLKAGSSDYK
jgi:hypothetical protein